MDLVYNDAEAARRTLNRIYRTAPSRRSSPAARSFVSGRVSLRLFARVVAFMLGKGKRFMGERLLGDRSDDAGPPGLAVARTLVHALAAGLSDDLSEAVARLALGLVAPDSDPAGPPAGLLGRTPWSASGPERCSRPSRISSADRHTSA